MDAFSIIQNFFTQMQCPHCGQHLDEHGVELLREENGMFLVHVECRHCHTEIGNAMVGMESPMSNMMRRAFGDGDATVIMDMDDDDDSDNEGMIDMDDDGEIRRFVQRINDSQKMPRFAGASGFGPLRRSYKDPELTPEEKMRLQEFKPVSSDDVIDAYSFIEGLGRDWQKHLPKGIEVTLPE